MKVFCPNCNGSHHNTANISFLLSSSNMYIKVCVDCKQEFQLVIFFSGVKEVMVWNLKKVDLSLDVH